MQMHCGVDGVMESVQWRAEIWRGWDGGKGGIDCPDLEADIGSRVYVGYYGLYRIWVDIGFGFL